MPDSSWRQSLEQIVGAQHVATAPEAIARWTWESALPQAVALPANREQVCELVRLAAANQLKVIPLGHGTKLHMGGPVPLVDFAISLVRLNQVRDYPASDLTITVDAGLPIAALESTLATKHQMLPLDVPHGQHATVGGTIAANMNGPRRLIYGTWRDIVLGVQYVTAEGKLAKGGGKVVKNVAGYDIPKLMIGSRGTLGIIVEVTFKAFPIPPARSTIVLHFESTAQAAQAALRIAHSQLFPQAVELIDSPDTRLLGEPQWLAAPGTVLVAVTGTEGVLARYQHDLPVLVRSNGLKDFAMMSGDSEAALWKGVQHFTTAFHSEYPEGVAVKASLPLTQVGPYLHATGTASNERGLSHTAIAHAGSGIVFAYAWPPSGETGAAAQAKLATVAGVLVGEAEQRGGRANVEICPTRLMSSVNLWGTLGDDFASMRALKAALDPKNIFSPGSFYGGI